MTNLLTIDKNLFYFINQSMVYPILDIAMVAFSSKLVATILIAASLFYAGMRRNWRLFSIICFALVGVGVADFTAYNILKPAIGRIRPCHFAPDLVRTISGCGGTYSFPSNHAANLGVIVFFATHYFGKTAGLTALLVAAVVGLSRVYLGAHYPLDVAVGILYGVLIGWVVFKVCRGCLQTYFPNSSLHGLLKRMT